jgi:hypothetical protein
VLFCVSPIQDFLHVIPNLVRHQGLVITLAPFSAIIELAGIDPLSERFVQRRHRNLALALQIRLIERDVLLEIAIQPVRRFDQYHAAAGGLAEEGIAG